MSDHDIAGLSRKLKEAPGDSDLSSKLAVALIQSKHPLPDHARQVLRGELPYIAN